MMGDVTAFVTIEGGNFYAEECGDTCYKETMGHITWIYMVDESSGYCILEHLN